MARFDILHPGVWFGPKQSLDGGAIVEEVVEGANVLKSICTQMKLGDFSGRSKLQELILSSRNPLVRQQSIRLYCSTCRHVDVAFAGNLMEILEHDGVLAVVVAAPDTLSAEIIPYLFALLEKYEGSSIATDIITSINRLFPWDHDGTSVDLSRLEEQFSGFAKNLRSGEFYYAGELAHPGNLCKSLVETTARAGRDRSKFPLANIPILLSNWSGERCPVYYGDSVDNQKMQAVLDYVSIIAKFPWIPGAKYFYGFRVN